MILREPCVAKFDEFHLSYTFHIFFCLIWCFFWLYWFCTKCFNFDNCQGTFTIQAIIFPSSEYITPIPIASYLRVTPKILIIYIKEKLVWCCLATQKRNLVYRVIWSIYLHFFTKNHYFYLSYNFYIFKRTTLILFTARKLSVFIQNGWIFWCDTCETRNQPGSRAPKMKIFPIFFIKFMTFVKTFPQKYD
jgi:hypothetical protein